MSKHIYLNWYIIEYKKDRNFSVVEEGMMYLNLVLRYKSNFIVQYNGDLLLLQVT
jgi:hypothetical protein